MRFLVFQSIENQQWYFRIVGANGEPVAQSEGYTSKQRALNTVGAIRAGAASATVSVWNGQNWVQA
jgi:uncharacterized protein